VLLAAMPKPLLLSVSKEQLEKRSGRMVEHPLYNTWRGMLERCNSVTSKTYLRYGKNGITVFDAWQSKKRHKTHKRWSLGFCLFLDYIQNTLGPKPKGFSLDRINNKKGYIPGNLRWADASLQKKNQLTKNFAGYKYVYPIKGSKKWQVEYKIGKKRIYVGSFDTKEKAYFEALAHRLEFLWIKDL
jgi:hypothetical protein